MAALYGDWFAPYWFAIVTLRDRLVHGLASQITFQKVDFWQIYNELFTNIRLQLQVDG
jgi:hypothetical protein